MKKQVMIGLTIVVVLVIGWFGYNHYVEAKNTERKLHLVSQVLNHGNYTILEEDEYTLVLAKNLKTSTEYCFFFDFETNSKGEVLYVNDYFLADFYCEIKYF